MNADSFISFHFISFHYNTYCDENKLYFYDLSDRSSVLTEGSHSFLAAADTTATLLLTPLSTILVLVLRLGLGLGLGHCAFCLGYLLPVHCPRLPAPTAGREGETKRGLQTALSCAVACPDCRAAGPRHRLLALSADCGARLRRAVAGRVLELPNSACVKEGLGAGQGEPSAAAQ